MVTSVVEDSRAFGGLRSAVARLPFLKTALSYQQILSLARWLMAILIFSSLFIPRMTVGELSSFYRVDFRLEDLLLALVAFLVLMVMAKAPNIFTPEKRPVEKAFLLFLMACQASIFSGIFSGTIDKPLMSLLYLIKWFEYFLVFVLTARLVSSEKDRLFFLRAFLGLGIAVSVYGYWEYFFPASKAVYPNYYRLFERPPFHGDANHIGGFLALWIAFFTGLFLSAKNTKQKWFLFAALLFAFLPFIWTYSRKSYAAIAATLGLSVFLTPHRRRIIYLICALALLGLLLPTRLSERLMDLGETFSSTDPFHSSWAGGLNVWKDSLWNFEKFWLWGSGLGSRHRLFYESQYVLILAETGILGFAAFLYLGWILIRQWVIKFFRNSSEQKPLMLGWILAFSALVIHSLSCVSWTVSKVAIPFWFLTALIFAKSQSHDEKSL